MLRVRISICTYKLCLESRDVLVHCISIPIIFKIILLRKLNQVVFGFCRLTESQGNVEHSRQLFAPSKLVD